MKHLVSCGRTLSIVTLYQSLACSRAAKQNTLIIEDHTVTSCEHQLRPIVRKTSTSCPIIFVKLCFSSPCEHTGYGRVRDIHCNSVSINTRFTLWSGAGCFLWLSIIFQQNTIFNTPCETHTHTHSWMAQRASYWLKQQNNMSASGDFDRDTC